MIGDVCILKGKYGKRVWIFNNFLFQCTHIIFYLLGRKLLPYQERKEKKTRIKFISLLISGLTVAESFFSGLTWWGKRGKKMERKWNNSFDKYRIKITLLFCALAGDGEEEEKEMIRASITRKNKQIGILPLTIFVKKRLLFLMILATWDIETRRLLSEHCVIWLWPLDFAMRWLNEGLFAITKTHDILEDFFWNFFTYSINFLIENYRVCHGFWKIIAKTLILSKNHVVNIIIRHTLSMTCSSTKPIEFVPIL